MRRLIRLIRSDLFAALALGFCAGSGAIVLTNPAMAAAVSTPAPAIPR